MRLATVAVIIFLTVGAWADVLTLNNGMKIEGSILSVEADSVALVTAGPNPKITKIALSDIQSVARTKESENAGPAIKKVGYGCLGGFAGAALSTGCILTLASTTDTDFSYIWLPAAGIVVTGIFLGVAMAK